MRRRSLYPYNSGHLTLVIAPPVQAPVTYGLPRGFSGQEHAKLRAKLHGKPPFETPRIGRQLDGRRELNAPIKNRVSPLRPLFPCVTINYKSAGRYETR